MSDPRDARFTRGEVKRKLVHIAVGGFAFLLRYLTWPQAAAMAALAFLFNWQVLPRIGGRNLWRGADLHKGYSFGILLYPLSVLALVLAFRGDLWKAGAVWGLLAFGDGMASLVGQACGGPRLPWNERKRWVGFLSFVACGSLGAAVLIPWTQGRPLGEAFSLHVLGLSLALATLGALVESVPTTLDDNLTVPLVCGVFLALVADLDFGPFLTDEDLPRRAFLGLIVNVAIAAAAFVARSIDLGGALSAVFIGTAITVGLGLAGLAPMIVFFVVGSAVTKLGYGAKAAKGISQEKGGARGWRNAWANGGVPAFLALLAGASQHQIGTFAPIALTVAYAASVATAAADTCSSEIGKAYGSRTWLITNLKPVSPGTEGAVSLEGTVGGLAGGAIVASIGACTGLYGLSVVPLVAVAALLGSLAESLIGTVAERRGWINNDLLNAVNTAIGAGIGVLLLLMAGVSTMASLGTAGS